MALANWLFEGVDGVVPASSSLVTTPADLTSIQVTQGGPVTFSSDQVHHGNTSLKFVTTDFGCIARLPLADSGMSFVAEQMVYVSGPMQTLVPMTVRHAGGQICRVVFNHQGSGRWGIIDSGTTTIADTPNDVVQLGTWYRLEVVGTVATATTGYVRLRIFLGNGTTPLFTLESSSANLGTAPAVAMDIGSVGPTPSASTLYIDTVRTNTGTTVPIGPFVPAAPLPTPNLTLVSTTNPSNDLATNGAIRISWPPVANASFYVAEIALGLNAETGFTTFSESATSPFTFTGLGPGGYTVAITAHPAD